MWERYLVKGENGLAIVEIMVIVAICCSVFTLMIIFFDGFVKEVSKQTSPITDEHNQYSEGGSYKLLSRNSDETVFYATDFAEQIVINKDGLHPINKKVAWWIFTPGMIEGAIGGMIGGLCGNRIYWLYLSLRDRRKRVSARLNENQERKATSATKKTIPLSELTHLWRDDTAIGSEKPRQATTVQIAMTTRSKVDLSDLTAASQKLRDDLNAQSAALKISVSRLGQEIHTEKEASPK